MSWFGIDFRGFAKSSLLAFRFFFDALFPFVFLFSVSYVTRPVKKELLNRFFAKMHTPVNTDPEKERAALEEAYMHPDKYEGDKVLKNSNWEILKPTRLDYLGFFGSWVLVGVILLLLWLMVNIH